MFQSVLSINSLIRPIAALNFWGENAAEQIQNAIDMWNDKYESIFSILTTSPNEFRGGETWTLISTVMNVLEATGISLLIVFFLYGLFKSSISYRDFTKNPKQIIFSLFRLLIAKFFVTYASDVLLAIIGVVQSILLKISNGTPEAKFLVPEDLKTALESADWSAGMGAFFASLLGTAAIFLLSIIVLVVVYGRFFKIFLLSAISPIPLAGFASEATESLGLNFMKSYIGECLRGVVILLACMIFSVFVSSPTGLNSSTPGGMTWLYIGEVTMQMLLLVIVVKGSDRLVKELFGL